jgi:predicted PurR-regulated permease PerM
VIISVIAIFFSLYPFVGVAWAAVLAGIAAFLEAGLGYIIFEKVLD